GGGAGDDEVEPGEAAAIDLVDQLSQRIQCSIADIGAHPLERLDLVEHEYQPWTTGIAQQRQQSGEEVQRAIVVEVALDAGSTLDAGGNVRLPPEPSQQTFCLRVVTGRDRG